MKVLGGGMMKIAIAGILIAILGLASCIFQNGPLEPNQPPTIRSYTPQATFFSMTIPDSCIFSIRATDPDGDQLAYSFFMGDSMISRADSAKFHAVSVGVYDIRGRAQDGATEAYHDWHVTVIEKNNQKPLITWFLPDQLLVSCAVGETLEFHFKATDDHPEVLHYSYELNGTLLHSGSPDLINRFMERGDFLLEGIVSDGQYADTVGWEVSVTGYPDTIPPAPIMDLSGGPGELDGSVWLEWTAPGDDGADGTAASYIVKTSVYPILTEEDWMEAEGKLGEPTPSPAGSRERMTIRNLSSASYVYVSMRAVDDFFNLSPIGNCIKILVRGVDIGGRAINAATGESIPGISIFTGSTRDTTDADGTYLLWNVPSYSTMIYAQDESVQGQVGNYYDCSAPITNITQHIAMDLRMIPAFPLVNTTTDIYQGRFLMFFKEITKTDGYLGKPTVYKGWNHWPITVYNPAMVYQDVDLQAACRNDLAEWEDSTGIDLFVEVPSASGADVVVIYDTTAAYKHHVETPASNPDGTPARREIWIYPKNSEVPVSRYANLIFAHELGHVIGLDHSRDPGHLMLGFALPLVQHPTTDEVRVVQVLYHMPYIYDYKYIAEE
jgi:hypothetical protein